MTAPLNLSQLRAFVAVVDSGGFGAGAAQLGLSQSAVSHAVAALERALDAPLLVRSTPVRTTALGAQTVEHARTAVASADAIEDVARRHTAELTGAVRLASTPSVCRGLLPPLLQRWAEALPGIHVRAFEGTETEAEAWLEDGTADVAILAGDAPQPGPGVLLATDPYLALLHRDHPLAREERVHVADLEDDALILSLTGCERQALAIHRAAGLPFAPAQRVRELATLIGLVEEGIGVSLVPEVVRPLIPNTLVMVPLLPHHTRSLVLRGPSARVWPATVRALADEARGQYGLRSPTH
jgi:DNA-binding transcriptional LysR family regulator